MLIDDILKKLEINNSRSYYTFETFILNLLKVHLQKNNKPFDSSPRRMGFDAFAPEGLEDIKGPTQIEIKFNVDRYPLNRFIDNILNRNILAHIEEFKNLLIITPTPISNRTRHRLEIITEKEKPPFDILIWGPEEVNKIVSKNRKEANDIANNLFSLRIESAVTR